jgi:hypothetical protein
MAPSLNSYRNFLYKLGASRRIIVSRCLCALILVSLLSNQSSAKRGGMHSEDRYNPQHINSLPPEIRKAIYHRCSTPRALHPFASYFDNSKRIVLHFEHFYCDQPDTFCGPTGCLHQFWVFAGGHYKLVRSYYAPAGD